MNLIKKGVAAVAALAVSAAIVVGLPSNSSATSPALPAFGITCDGTLMAAFRTNNPQVLDWVRLVSGLSVDKFLIGIDTRVQDGKLYGVGNHGGIYTFVMGPDGNLIVTKVSQLSVALHGTAFGVDFNPAADRLRVISDTGQNLRHDLNSHVTAVDSPLSALGVTAAAYTNNDLHADTVTTLFDINTVTDQVVIQSPANSGLLAPTGALGVHAATNAGFDIFSDLSNGKTISNMAFAAFIPPTGRATLYTVDVLTGAATGVGEFPLPLCDVAVAIDSN